MKFIKKYLNFILSAVLILSLCISIRSCEYYKNLYNNADHNIKALNDTLTVINNKYGEQVYTRLALEGDLKSIKELNSDLYNEINDLKKSIKLKEDIITGLSFYADIENEPKDTVWQVVRISENIEKYFDFSNDFRKLNGKVSYKEDSLKLNIDEDKIFVNYTIMIDESSRVYIKSDNPYAKINALNSYTLPKQLNKRFSVGPYVGLGYDFVNNQVSPTLGIGVQYSIFKF